MIKYRAGDKITVEYELGVSALDPSKIGFTIETTVAPRFLVITENTSKLKIVSHTPKAVEPARGQLWYDSDQDYNNHVIACEDGWVMYRNTSSNQPYMMPVATFQKAKRYVSG